MKTFLILFVIAVSMPTEAQRVKENVRQHTKIIERIEPSVHPGDVASHQKRVRNAESKNRKK